MPGPCRNSGIARPGGEVGAPRPDDGNSRNATAGSLPGHPDPAGAVSRGVHPAPSPQTTAIRHGCPETSSIDTVGRNPRSGLAPLALQGVGKHRADERSVDVLGNKRFPDAAGQDEA